MDWRSEREESVGARESAEAGWGEVEFRAVELGDKRVEQRLKMLAEDFFVHPQAPINQASEDGAATKAAYGFFENPKASGKKIFAARRDCTVQRRFCGLQRGTMA